MPDTDYRVRDNENVCKEKNDPTIKSRQIIVVWVCEKYYICSSYYFYHRNRIMDYHPIPLSIDHPMLPEHLIERVARDVHDHWTQERQRQGWTWGEHRDDDKKEHPGMAPYDMLTDDEKEVDRVTVRAVIASLLAQGATITLDGR